jgi:hypothetical protein
MIFLWASTALPLGKFIVLSIICSSDTHQRVFQASRHIAYAQGTPCGQIFQLHTVPLDHSGRRQARLFCREARQACSPRESHSCAFFLVVRVSSRTLSYVDTSGVYQFLIGQLARSYIIHSRILIRQFLAMIQIRCIINNPLEFLPQPTDSSD